MCALRGVVPSQIYGSIDFSPIVGPLSRSTLFPIAPIPWELTYGRRLDIICITAHREHGTTNVQCRWPHGFWCRRSSFLCCQYKGELIVSWYVAESIATNCRMFWPHRSISTAYKTVLYAVDTKATQSNRPAISCYWFCYESAQNQSLMLFAFNFCCLMFTTFKPCHNEVGYYQCAW